jgi:hypothetical protein
MIRRLVDSADGVHHIALVLIVLPPEGQEGPAGVAHLMQDPDDPATADIPVTVADDWQGRGVGTALDSALMHRRPAAIKRLRTVVDADNHASLALLAGADPRRWAWLTWASSTSRWNSPQPNVSAAAACGRGLGGAQGPPGRSCGTQLDRLAGQRHLPTSAAGTTPRQCWTPVCGARSHPMARASWLNTGRHLRTVIPPAGTAAARPPVA